MSPLRKLLWHADKVTPTVSQEKLVARSDALLRAVDAGEAHLPAEDAAAARALRAKVQERTAVRGTRTVAALAGATGSGKSSIFNFLVGEPASRIGARRPTTAQSTAAVWGDEPSAPVLDWLQVERRHQVAGGQADSDALDGLVLLDLPDFDSRVSAHRAEADRVLERADVFVWVTDPQKYADAVLHDEYVRRLATYDTVTLVVLNQVDRLTPSQVQECVADLERLMRRDGLGEVTVIPTSAVTGVGLWELARELARVVQTKNAAEQRLAADVRSRAEELRAYVGDAEPEVSAKASPELVDALGRAAGVPLVEKAVERDYRMRAVQATGWPFTRWTTRLRAAPLRRLGLDRPGSDGRPALTGEDVRVLTGRSSLPPATPAARAAVEVATRRLGESAAAGLPPSWGEAVQDAATPPDRSMTDALDQAVLSTPLPTGRPWWWVLFSVLQWLLAAVAVAGLAWLLVLMVLGWVQIDVGVPRWGWLPVPLVLLVGGVVLGLLLAAIARWIARRAARHRAAATRRQLTKAITAVADEKIVAPVRHVLQTHRTTREELAEAAR
ncbi:GTPase [Luteipulveratus flavus]|uniref:50S ribosome-binding GTPase n=1 Tax=Luteipulveratus flavus TaxID=3031728 RepID=A0ABT6C946_9MICO|nr:GTPase [Luteipulveratus sp. YIM 133296]MDF8265388.1 50S ribosome-binding GTPase [Luteipulveratus sp. YIM 133296]